MDSGHREQWSARSISAVCLVAISASVAAVCSSAIPQSVQNIVFEGKAFDLTPECRCFLAFSMSPGDAARIVNEKGFQSRPPGDWKQSGPAWFKPPTNGLLFTRSVPTSLLRFPRLDQREYFWIDETGTNGFFLVWRLD